MASGDDRRTVRRPALDAGALLVPRRGLTVIRSTSMAKAVPWLAGGHPDIRPAQDIHCLNADDCRGQHHRTGIEDIGPAPLFRAVSALRALPVAALRATALGAWEGWQLPGYRCLHLRGPARCRPGASQTWMLEHGEPGRADGASRTAGFHLSSLYSPPAGAVGKMWRRLGDVPSEGSRIRCRDQDLQEHRTRETWSRKAKRLTGNDCWNAVRTIGSGPFQSGGLLLTAGADVQKDRIEISVWPSVEQGILAGRASRADGRYRPRRGVEIAGQRAAGNVDAETGCQQDWVVLRIGYRLCDAGSLCVCPKCAIPRDGGSKGWRVVQPWSAPRRRRCHVRRQETAPGIKVFSVAGGIAKLEFYNNLRKHRRWRGQCDDPLSRRLCPSAQGGC